VVDASLITALKAAPVRFPVTLRHIRMPEFFAVMHIRTAMIPKVFPRPLHTVMEPVTMHFIQLRRRRIRSRRVQLLNRRRKKNRRGGAGKKARLETVSQWQPMANPWAAFFIFPTCRRG
jgi:hypothetical protein